MALCVSMKSTTVRTFRFGVTLFYTKLAYFEFIVAVSQPLWFSFLPRGPGCPTMTQQVLIEPKGAVCVQSRLFLVNTHTITNRQQLEISFYTKNLYKNELALTFSYFEHSFMRPLHCFQASISHRPMGVHVKVFGSCTKWEASQACQQQQQLVTDDWVPSITVLLGRINSTFITKWI